MYASAQSLDFLAWTKNHSFPDRKLLVSHPEFPDGNYLHIPAIAASDLKEGMTDLSQRGHFDRLH
jgi:hypothetical protein